MAAAKKAAKRPVAKKAKSSVPMDTKAAKKAAKKPAPSVPSAQPASSNQNVKGLRVRMFRVGFGDFFLLTVPTAKGDKHILIDCGVHAKDLKSIQAAVTQMAADCGNKLALAIMTHRHADHISGFGTCSNIFGQINVHQVWMPWVENAHDKAAAQIAPK